MLGMVLLLSFFLGIFPSFLIPIAVGMSCVICNKQCSLVHWFSYGLCLVYNLSMFKQEIMIHLFYFTQNFLDGQN